ncbi:MAG: ATP-binding cassette domain-containing protein [Burkholderiales bacterium]|jgi:ABC-type methionine transport system ATPase subunit|nr:ATP-binding cassette domain-containing protein [Burkholderiales bacterium]
MSAAEARAPGPAEPVTAFRLRDVRQVRGVRTLLDGISLDLPRGGFTALIGPSGAGKTSLLRLLNRLDDPASGTVELFGRAVAEYRIRELRRRVGYVFQTPVMFAGTARDNLEAAHRLAKTEVPAVGDARIAALLELAGLDASYADRPAADLSGGEKHRVSIARALTTNPDVLLLDEPTAALDPEVADRLMHTLAQLRETTGITMVMVTHRLREARVAATYVVMLEAGRVVEAGEAATVMHDATHARTRAFLQAGEGDAA